VLVKVCVLPGIFRSKRVELGKCYNRHKEEIMGILDRSFLLQLFILFVLLT